MSFIYLIIFALVAFFVITHLMGRPDFWKATRKNTDSAWEFFNNHPTWYVGVKPANVDVVGPFRAVNPKNEDLVKLWCNSTRIEAS